MSVRTAMTAAMTAAGIAAGGAAAADPLASGRGGGLPGDWAGFYLGATAGIAGTTGEARRGDFAGALIALDVENGLFPGSIDDAGVAGLGGVTLGYGVQRGAFVGGVELDYAVTSLDAEAGFRRVDPNPDPMFNGVDTITGYETSIDGLATLRLRAGRAAGPDLFYATGGLAMGRVENRFTLDLPQLGYASGWSEDGYRYGVAVGAGWERRLSGRASLKAEVLYYDLGDATVEARDEANFAGQALDYRFDNAGVIGRVGINMRF